MNQVGVLKIRLNNNKFQKVDHAFPLLFTWFGMHKFENILLIVSRKKIIKLKKS